MINVEYIFPYTIVKENDFYGITDNTDKLVVPCIMDYIDNMKDDKIGLELWSDYSCVVVRKNEKYGFFTTNGKFIEPAYEDWTVDPFERDIHVKTNDGFGVFEAPKYLFREIPAESSLLFDKYLDDYEEDIDDFDSILEELLGANLKTWWEMGIEKNIISSVKGKLHTFGYDYTQDLWNSTYNDNDQINIEEFTFCVLSRLDDYDMIKEKVENIKAINECDEATFWNIAEEHVGVFLLPWCINMIKRGAVSFISLKSMAHANIPLLNRKVSELLKGDRVDGYMYGFRLIDELLPYPTCRSREIIPIQFPIGKRPSCRYSSFGDETDGEIGEIYLYEHSMHMYYVSVNVYDSEFPEKLLAENHILNISDIVLSELLTCLQQAIDPAKENTKLSAAIENAKNIENGKSTMAQILTDCGIHLLSLSDFGRSPRFYDSYIAEDVDYIYVSNNDVMLVLDSYTPKINIVPLSEQCGGYSWIVEDIKAAANIAYKKSKI